MPMESKPTEPQPSSSDYLPPVRPPSVGFLLQLFVIPMIIVLIIVMVWLMFTWLAHAGRDPHDLVRNIRRNNDKSWQDAGALADLLRDPRRSDLKRNDALAGELAAILRQFLDAGRTGERDIRMRIFLCRTLGEFQSQAGVETLLRAAREERDPAELSVRYAALEALAVLIQNVGAPLLRDRKDVLETLRAAANERDEVPEAGTEEVPQPRAELRSTAAFTLGVLGGDEALEKLATILDDAYPNARYNAATGLARAGDERCRRVLLEMLEPDNRWAVKFEKHDSERERKRALVLTNGLRAVTQFARAAPAADLADLVAAIERLQDDRHADVKVAARETLLGLKKKP